MKNKHGIFFGFAVFLIAVMFTLVGCGPKPTPARDFDFSDGVIYRYTGKNKDVVIPAKINGKRVTSIGGNGFYAIPINSVIIPKGITTIEALMFWHCDLTSVTIPNSVTSIGESAFGQNKLTSVTIPDSVISIGEYAFGSNLLTNITIGSNVALSISTNEYGVELGPFGTKLDFEKFYNENGKKAGTYTRENWESEQWSFKAR
ncbi:hypothetical protein AGMMS49928_19940 [Spirochaetia bacterium]|nr:hypothetical protein AGMMS49928_19940 [Spirochaetia bacterium]